jgi:hypothetical protein
VVMRFRLLERMTGAGERAGQQAGSPSPAWVR